MNPTMRAAVLGASGVEIADRPVPTPAAEQVRVRIEATALNRADLAVLGGAAHGAQGGVGTILGMEFAGVVDAIGPQVTGVAVGDRVMGFGAGAYAEAIVVDQGRVLPLPKADLDMATAATLPVALLTMHDAVVVNGGLRKGQTVLIQGASTGVGLMGLQIAKHLGASKVIGSSTDAERRGKLAGFGADLAVDTRDPAWSEQVLEATGGRGVDLIVDQLAGPVMNGNLNAVAIGGRIVNVGRLAGMSGELDFDLHAKKRVQYVGVTFRTRNVEEVREVVRKMRADLWPAVADGTLALPIAARYALEDIGEAFALMKANRHLGKIVVDIKRA